MQWIGAPGIERLANIKLSVHCFNTADARRKKRRIASLTPGLLATDFAYRQALSPFEAAELTRQSHLLLAWMFYSL